MTATNASLAELQQTPPPFEVTLGNEQTEFSGSNRLFSEVATVFGVEVEPQERKDWQTLGRAAYIIDQYLDVERDDVMPDIAPRLFSGQPIPGVPEELSRDCRQFLERQSPARQAEIQELLVQVKLLVDAQAVAELPADVIRIRQQEAELLANLLSLPVDGRHDAQQRHRLNAWLIAFCRTGYMLDSFLDLNEDYSSGASRVPPNFHARRVLAGATLKEARSARHTMSLKLLGKCAMVAVRYELRNKKPDFTKPNQVI